ncbi:MAG TPA: cupredoxin family copper-binding protein [Methanothrix sp.]|jgi:plastocyanin|nr:cupredoxin family copper-binding protein [Methanothrix sp.]HPC89544.1 cupredoxin family copper-binding protein [Methanothrix sp.]HQI68004.1 cupredoxin family copper-binding protein [Methanothrix sp.]HRS84865.1 cupredoxin family copper-binding protein [Methanothrix sp.]HRT16958.1 cupredoxin family copper-binding protein [Methanothrix sp.]
MRINQIKLLLILTIAAIMLISSTDAAADSRVNIKNGSFVPSALTVSSGTTVEWHNQDAIQHRIVSSQGLFDSGLIDPGKKFSIKFNNPGTYNYYCSLHPQMQGSVTVSGTTAMGAQQTSLSASWSESPLSASSGNFLPVPTVGAAAGATTSSSQIASSTGSGSYAKTGRSTSSQVSVEKYSQYYSSSTGAPEEQLTAPTQVQLNEVQPDTLYFGASQTAVPYTQYQTYSLSTGGNWLWISGRDSWTQYAMVPLGSVLNLIAISPSGGYGSLYEIYPGGDLNENTYSFYAYNQLRFYADEVGQHLLFFNVASQPSNVIVVDVVPYQPTYPSVYGYSSVTVRSNWLRGYNVYVDGSLAATEGRAGNQAGSVTFSVQGDQYHNIAIDGAGLTYSDYKYFKSGYAYQLNV